MPIDQLGQSFAALSTPSVPAGRTFHVAGASSTFRATVEAAATEGASAGARLGQLAGRSATLELPNCTAEIVRMVVHAGSLGSGAAWVEYPGPVKGEQGPAGASGGGFTVQTVAWTIPEGLTAAKWQAPAGGYRQKVWRNDTGQDAWVTSATWWQPADTVHGAQSSWSMSANLYTVTEALEPDAEAGLIGSFDDANGILGGMDHNLASLSTRKITAGQAIVIQVGSGTGSAGDLPIGASVLFTITSVQPPD